ncbi:MAG: hypothetical protein HYY36_00355 [Gammaproteobacteria bacterium]|nr:hypothetical protein [Gammaproteobacteria bacterium]
MRDLDPAAFRRFDLKVRFDPLRLEQKLDLMALLASSARGRSVCSNGSETPPAPWADDAGVQAARARLARMDQLTLGDFRAALRSLELTGAAIEAESLLEALEEEYRFKEDGLRRPIGFVG